MERIAKRCGILLVLLFAFSGCANGEDMSTKVTDENIQEVLQEEHWETAVSVPCCYTVLQETERIEPEDPYCNTDDAGKLHLYDLTTEGTPYESQGIVYDEAFFDVQQMVSVTEGGEYEVGGGTTEYHWILTPKSSGQTQILILQKYLVTDKLEGRLFQISVTEDGKCSIAWYMDGTEDEMFTVLDES